MSCTLCRRKALANLGRAFEAGSDTGPLFVLLIFWASGHRAQARNRMDFRSTSMSTRRRRPAARHAAVAVIIPVSAVLETRPYTAMANLRTRASNSLRRNGSEGAMNRWSCIREGS